MIFFKCLIIKQAICYIRIPQKQFDGYSLIHRPKFNHFRMRYDIRLSGTVFTMGKT